MKLFALILLAGSLAFGQKATIADYKHCNDLLDSEDFLVTTQQEQSSSDWTDIEQCRMNAMMTEIDWRIKAHTLGGLPNHEDGCFRPANEWCTYKTIEFWKSIQHEAIPLWSDVRDLFCEFHSESAYVDTFGNVEQCPKNLSPIHTNRAKITILLNKSITLNQNVQTFALAEDSSGKGFGER
jgi:hypothetical protein